MCGDCVESGRLEDEISDVFLGSASKIVENFGFAPCELDGSLP